MTVYVDDMMAPYRGMLMCHMVADTAAELHAMADKIGVARKWHQGDHFDVAKSKRDLALAAGAVPVTLRQMGKMTFIRRRTGVLGNPATCDAEFTRLRNTPRAAE